MPPVPADPGPAPAEGPARAAGRLSGPLFRDEQPRTAVPGASETVRGRGLLQDDVDVGAAHS
ncbi:hypothetical protein ABZ885_24615, partial [Kitasatospora sp. NPDC047058]